MASLQGTQCIIFCFPTLQRGGYTSHTFPLTSTSGDVNNLNPNGVYQFSVVAQVTIMGQLYSGEMDTSQVNTPAITTGKVLSVTILQTNDRLPQRFLKPGIHL